MLDCKFTYFINEQSVFNSRKGPEMFSLPNRPDHSGGAIRRLQCFKTCLSQGEKGPCLKADHCLRYSTLMQVTRVSAAAVSTCLYGLVLNKLKPTLYAIGVTNTNYIFSEWPNLAVLSEPIDVFTTVRTDSLQPVGILMVEAIPRDYQQPHLQYHISYVAN